MYDIVQNTRCTQSFKVHSSFKKEEEGPKAQSGQRQLGALDYFLKMELSAMTQLPAITNVLVQARSE